MGEISMKFVSDATKMLSDMQKTIAAQGKMQKAAGETGKAVAKQRKEQAAMAREALKIEKQVATPQEKYKQRMEEINKLHKAGAINEETHRRAGARAWRDSGLSALRVEEKLRAERSELSRVNKASEDRRRVLRSIQTPLQRHNEKMRELQKLLKAGTISQNEFNLAAKKTATEFESADRAGKSTFGEQGLARLKSYAGGLIGAGGVLLALRAVKNEYNTILERQRIAAQITQGPAAAQETFLANLAADTPTERDAAIARAKAISQQQGVPIAGVYQRGSEAVSARGEKSVRYAMSAVEASYKFAPGDAEAGRAGASAALDIGRATGWNPEQALGFLQVSGKQARITSPGKLARNVAPTLGALIDMGASPQEAGGLFSALSQRMVDANGEQVRTASINFSKKLRDFTNEAVDTGRIKAGDVDTMGERLKYVQADKQRQTDFLNNNTFEALASIPIEKLIRGGNTFQLYKQFRDELPTAEEAGAGFRRRVRIREGAALQKTASLSRRAETTKETLALQSPSRARAGVVETEFDEIMRQSGEGYHGLKSHRLFMALGGGDLPAMRRQLSIRKATLEGTNEARQLGDRLLGWNPFHAAAQSPTAADLENAAAIGRLIEKMDDLIESNRETVEGVAAGVAEIQRRDPAVSHEDRQ